MAKFGSNFYIRPQKIYLVKVYYTINLFYCQDKSSFGYNDPEHFWMNRVEALRKIKALWNKSRRRSKIKVKGRNFFNQIKELASYYDNYITILSFTQKGDWRRVCPKGSFREFKGK